jgi:hypothetical protein
MLEVFGEFEVDGIFKEKGMGGWRPQMGLMGHIEVRK